MRELEVMRGSYVRDRAGVWRYAWGEQVPGGVDLTLLDLMAIDPVAAYDLVEDHRQFTDDELRWLAGHPVPADRLVLQRPGVRRPHAGDLVVGIQAPELHVMTMMTVTDVAEHAQVSKATIDSYRYRGYLPHPQVTRGRTPLWTRPIVRRWLRDRPGCGWRSDVHGERPVQPRRASEQRAPLGEVHGSRDQEVAEPVPSA